MNWSTFQHHGEAPATAFESFVTQLFDRWCRAEFGKRLRHIHALDGRGGDGGVEAFAVLDDGSEVGLQAKWFSDSFDAGRTEQVKNSLSQARRRHPRLTRYIVCLPEDLKDSKDIGKKQKSELDRWNELVAGAATDHPGVVVEYWGNTKLEGLLATVDIGSMRTYWFAQHTLRPADLADICRAAIAAHFRERYLPDLHQTGRIDQKIEEHLRTSSVRRRDLGELRQVCEDLSRIAEEVRRLERLPDRPLAQEPLRKAAEATLQHLIAVLAFAQGLDTEHVGGDLRTPDEDANTKLPETPEEMSQLLSVLKDRDDNSAAYATSHECLVSVKAAVGLLTRLESLATRVHETAGPLIIDGPPGIGKTHGVVASVVRRNDAGLPVVIIRAGDLDPTNAWPSLLGHALGQPGWSTLNFLNALEAAAHIADRTRGGIAAPDTVNVEPCRTLVVIDGLEESANASKWPSRLIELASFIHDRPRIKLVVTTRNSTFDHCISGFAHQSDQLSLTEHTSVPVDQLFRAYCDHYHVHVEGLSWLPWLLRTPLAVRLFTELHQDETVHSGSVLPTSVPALLKAKIGRIEDELRQHSETGWSAQDSILSAALRALTQAFVKGEVPMSRSRALSIVQGISAPPGLINHARAAAVLDGCRTHGILDGWQRPSADPLGADEWVYQPAFNAITDYLLANEVYRGIGTSSLPATQPGSLEYRDDAAAIVVAMLTSDGRFAVQEGLWRDTVDRRTLERWQLRALVDLQPVLAIRQEQWVRQKLTRSMPDCRDVMNELVIPAARLPSHPYGATFVDSALRPLPMAERDLFWSGPDELPENCGGPWEGNAQWGLDEVNLDPGDGPIGLPTLMVWSLASVVETRCISAQSKLSRWGARHPAAIAELLGTMATVNDGQLVERLFIAAAGAALACDPGNAAIGTLAETCDRLLFRDNAPAYTNNAITRHAARIIVERAHLLGHLGSADIVQRARPPYKARAPHLLPFDLNVTVEDRRHILSYDLHRYVADTAVDGFFELSVLVRDESESRPLHEVSQEVINALAATSAAAATELAARRQRNSEFAAMYGPFRITLAQETAATPASDTTVSISTESPDLPADAAHQSEGQAKAMAEQLVFIGPPSPPRHMNTEAAALLAEYAAKAGMDRLTANELAVGLIVPRVKSFGWNAEFFYGRPNGNKPGEVMGADIAIMREHHPASHGSRSAVATFAEKYVFIAVNEIAGYLADRLPCGEHEPGNPPRMVTDYGELGAGLPDPLAGVWNGRESETPGQLHAANRLWIPEDLLPEVEGIDAPDQLAHALEWMKRAPLPDFAKWCRPGDDTDQSILGAFIVVTEPISMVKVVTWISAFAATPENMLLMRADLNRGIIPPFFRNEEFECGLGNATYLSPSVACWAPWPEPIEEMRSYVTMDAENNPVLVQARTLMASVMWDVPGVGERETWLPGPLLRDACGLIGSSGDHEKRKYFDRSLQTLSEYIDNRKPTHRTSAHRVLTADTARLEDALQKNGLSMAWYIRLYRDIPHSLIAAGGSAESGQTDHRVVVLGKGEVFTQLVNERNGSAVSPADDTAR